MSRERFGYEAACAYVASCPVPKGWEGIDVRVDAYSDALEIRMWRRRDDSSTDTVIARVSGESAMAGGAAAAELAVNELYVRARCDEVAPSRSGRTIREAIEPDQGFHLRECGTVVVGSYRFRGSCTPVPVFERPEFAPSDAHGLASIPGASIGPVGQTLYVMFERVQESRIVNGRRVVWYNLRPVGEATQPSLEKSEQARAMKLADECGDLKATNQRQAEQIGRLAMQIDKLQRELAKAKGRR